MMRSYLFEEFLGGDRSANYLKLLATLLEGNGQQFAPEGIAPSYQE
jgi:hypothetical protein